MTKPSITVAVSDSDRINALLDGRVTIEGVDAAVQRFSVNDLFGRLLHGPAFDVTELSFSSYLVQHAAGDCPYIAVPVFPSRAFRHGIVHVRKDRIRRPCDLIDARVGVLDYAMTPNVWVRAFLQEDHGVRPEDIRWVHGTLPHGKGRRLGASLPPQLRIEPAPGGSTLWQLLARGEIDAVIDPHPPPRSLRLEQPLIAPLFDEALSEARAYHRRTGIFPILHVLAIRRDVAQQHPWLPAAVVRAFTEAKTLAQQRLMDTAVAVAMVPFLDEHLSQLRDSMGDDVWPYGVTGSLPTLDAFVRYHHAQGLSPRQLTVHELFHPSTRDPA